MAVFPFGRKMTIEFTRSAGLTENLLVLDGLTGTGKTMIASLLESYDRVEVGRFIYDIEFISISGGLGQQSHEATKAILGLIIDSKLYDNMISREVNFRPSDLSSVFKSRRVMDYLKRLFRPDGDAVENRLKSENPIMMINTHQLLGMMDALFDQFEHRIKVVEMQRHPLYMLEHWMSYMDMHGNSARDFTIWLKDHDGKPVPWFAHDWKDEYWSLSKFDRVVLSIDSLTRARDRQYASQSSETLMCIPFEDFTLNTHDYVDRIANWLGTTVTSTTARACKSQNLPRQNINAGMNRKIYQRYGYRNTESLESHEDNYQSRLDYARSHQTERSTPVLERLINSYEAQHGLWF